MYADIEVEKQDSQTGTKTQGDATFNGATFAIKDTSGNVLETITTNGSKAKSKKYPVGTTLNVCEVVLKSQKRLIKRNMDYSKAMFKSLVKDLNLILF